MLKPIALPKSIVTRLEDRINDEYTAHYFYTNASNTAEDLGYTVAAAYFAKEAGHELEHAKKLEKFLTDWNIKPKLKAIDSPAEVSDFVDMIEKSYNIEYDLYSSYEEDAFAVMHTDKNIATFNLLQEFIQIQKESVAEYATLLNKLALIDTTDKSWVYDFQRTELA